MVRAVLVGNGPSVLEHEMGERIDSFDVVLRFNRWKYKINGETHGDFSKSSGKKCTHWVVSDNHFFDSQLGQKFGNLYDNVIVVIPKFKYKVYQSHFTNIQKVHNNVTFIPTSFEDDINTIVNFSPKWPSTGVMGMHYAMGQFDEVFLYGFDTFNFKYDTLHYFEDRLNPFKNKSKIDHSPDLEKKYINYMVNNNHLKILT